MTKTNKPDEQPPVPPMIQGPGPLPLPPIFAIAFCNRVGPSLDSNDREYVSSQHASFELNEIEQFGPGVWIRYKDQRGTHRFVPMSNIRALDVVGGTHPIWETKP